MLGIAGCLVPALPGPPLNFLALFLIKLFIPDSLSWIIIIVFGVLTAAVTILDYVLPVWGSRIYKASGAGVWGSVIGMFVGIFFFPPWGMIPGLLAGAVIGEISAGKQGSEALRIGLVTFAASIVMIIVKLLLSGIMTFYVLAEILSQFL